VGIVVVGTGKRVKGQDKGTERDCQVQTGTDVGAIFSFCAHQGERNVFIGGPVKSKPADSDGKLQVW